MKTNDIADFDNPSEMRKGEAVRDRRVRRRVGEDARVLTLGHFARPKELDPDKGNGENGVFKPIRSAGRVGQDGGCANPSRARYHPRSDRKLE